MEKLQRLQEILEQLNQGDAPKFYEGNNAAAGTRIRKAMQEVKNLAQEVRLEVQEAKNAAKA